MTLIRRSRWTLGTGGLAIAGAAALAVATLALPAAAARPHDVLCPTATSTTDGFVACQSRLLDTRIAAQPGPITNFAQVQVGDNAATGDAVELTVTTTGSAGAGYVTAYPDGGSAPATSNVNYFAGRNYSSTVLVAVPANGKIDFKLVGAATDLVVDEQGFFQASELTGATPTRIGDSRIANDGFSTTGPQSGTVTLQAPAAEQADVLALNVTTVTPAPAAGHPVAPGYVEVYGTTAPASPTSVVNQRSGTTASNLVFVRPDATGKITFVVDGAPTDLIVDLEAYAPTGSTLLTTSAMRLADSRTGSGLPTGPVTGAHTITLTAAEAPAGTTAVALNVTAVDPTGLGYVVTYPGGTTAPATSELQYSKGVTVAQTIVVPITPPSGTDVGGGTVTIDVPTGAATNLVVDLQASVGTVATS